MTNNSIFLHRVNNGSTNILKARENVVKISRTGIFICTQGEATVLLDKKKYYIEAHSLFTYFAFSELRIERCSNDLQGILVGGNLEAIQPLLYKIADFNSLFIIRKNPYIVLTQEQERGMLMYAELIDDLLNQIHGMREENKGMRIAKELLITQLEQLGNSFMLNIVNCHSKFHPQSKLTNRKEDVLVRFVASLYKNYKTEHEVTFYSNQQYLTCRYFSAIIKEKSGKTPSQWIATALLVDAKNKLRQTNMSIKEVSEELCFPNQSYFGKWFKNLTGISPFEFKSGKEETKIVEDEFTDIINRSATLTSLGKF